MAEHEPHFNDDSGFLSLFLGLVVVIGMAALPATIGWVQYVG
ncbi:hypothetical protein [Halomonas salinarum]|nr:hypothetical protein [Halomonas salinarum]